MEMARFDPLASVDEKSASTVFEEKLTTSSTGGNGLGVATHNGYTGQTAAALTNEIAHERALCAKCEAVARVLDVGTFDHPTVGRVTSRSNTHVRIGTIGSCGGVDCSLREVQPTESHLRNSRSNSTLRCAWIIS